MNVDSPLLVVTPTCSPPSLQSPTRTSVTPGDSGNTMRRDSAAPLSCCMDSTQSTDHASRTCSRPTNKSPGCGDLAYYSSQETKLGGGSCTKLATTVKPTSTADSNSSSSGVRAESVPETHNHSSPPFSATPSMPTTFKGNHTCSLIRRSTPLPRGSKEGTAQPPQFRQQPSSSTVKSSDSNRGTLTSSATTDFVSPRLRHIGIYTDMEQIGEGTYGLVFKAAYQHSNWVEYVALKKIRMDNEKEGFPVTAIREIKILRELNHPNVIKLKEIVTDCETENSSANTYMVFEYMDHDLKGLMETPSISKWFTQPQIKCYMKQLLEGLHYCHSNHVLHRDIKASNLLINNEGILKIADFGLARPFNDQRMYTNRVITLWYRPPELLLGETSYGPAVDMWSVGCILAELLIKKPLFPGTTELEQLELIFKICGTPDRSMWPEAEELPFYTTLMPQMAKQNYPRKFQELFPDVSPQAFNLIERLLTLNPAHRISAATALDADYFWTNPRPADPRSLPRYPPTHEWNLRKRKPTAPLNPNLTEGQTVETKFDQQTALPPTAPGPSYLPQQVPQLPSKCTYMSGDNLHQQVTLGQSYTSQIATTQVSLSLPPLLPPFPPQKSGLQQDSWYFQRNHTMPQHRNALCGLPTNSVQPPNEIPPGFLPQNSAIQQDSLSLPNRHPMSVVSTNSVQPSNWGYSSATHQGPQTVVQRYRYQPAPGKWGRIQSQIPQPPFPQQTPYQFQPPTSKQPHQM